MSKEQSRRERLEDAYNKENDSYYSNTLHHVDTATNFEQPMMTIFSKEGGM
jgi:hypothetical protein